MTPALLIVLLLGGLIHPVSPITLIIAWALSTRARSRSGSSGSPSSSRSPPWPCSDCSSASPARSTSRLVEQPVLGRPAVLVPRRRGGRHRRPGVAGRRRPRPRLDRRPIRHLGLNDGPRTLTDHLRRLGRDELVDLLDLRPDLALSPAGRPGRAGDPVHHERPRSPGPWKASTPTSGWWPRRWPLCRRRPRWPRSRHFSGPSSRPSPEPSPTSVIERCLGRRRRREPRPRGPGGLRALSGRAGSPVLPAPVRRRDRRATGPTATRPSDRCWTGSPGHRPVPSATPPASSSRPRAQGPIDQLLAHRLLRPLDSDTVILPREVALHVRGGRFSAHPVAGHSAGGRRPGATGRAGRPGGRGSSLRAAARPRARRPHPGEHPAPAPPRRWTRHP